ncbi:hypothetical protein [Caballeronia concitans]|uniref:Lipoprotein n=1 Tax=Caballeronia concitans TaxID=1777133 RepID=A0A658R5H1_9BURK|nr:hypothetical protein [Caballeronia concitans]SAL52559.1 hypothetical protein AWB72_05608 [Caballeronia concitans]
MGNSQRSASLVVASILVPFFVGCAGVKAVSEQKHELSNVPAGKFNVVLYNSPPNAKPIILPGVSPPDQERQLRIAEAACGSASPVAKPPPIGKPGLFIAPVVGILVVAGLSVAVSEAEAKYSAFVDKRQAEFKKTFDRSFNVDYLLVDELPTFNCIVASIATKAAPTESDLDFVFGAVLRSSVNTHPVAYQWVPTYFELKRSSARTDASGAVDISVEIAIDGATSKGNQTLSDVTLALKGLCLPNGDACDSGNIGTWQEGQPSKDPLGVGYASPWFTLQRSVDGPQTLKPCSGNCTPGSFRVTVVETGTGAADYGAAKTGLANTDKALSDAIGKIIDLKTPKN